jgi:hypothetical protein
LQPPAALDFESHDAAFGCFAAARRRRVGREFDGRMPGRRVRLDDVIRTEEHAV